MNKLILLAATAALLFASTDAATTVDGGKTQALAKGDTVTISGLTTGSHVCWTAAGSGTQTRACAAAATATDIGATGCSAVTSGSATTVALTWTTLAGTNIGNSVFGRFYCGWS
jgi:hypothetical protein